MKKKILKILVASLCISAAFGIFVIITETFNELTAKILGSTSVIFGFSITGLCCATLYEDPKLKKVSTLGIIINCIACLYTLLLVWGLLDICIIFCKEKGYGTLNMLFTLLLLSSSSAHISLILNIKNTNQTVNIVQCGTIITSLIIDFLYLLGIWAEIELSWKVLVILIILCALGTIVAPILNLIYKDSRIKRKNNSENIASNEITQS